MYFFYTALQSMLFIIIILVPCINNVYLPYLTLPL